MPNVMFTISYTIKPERRNDYLSLVGKMKNHLTAAGKEYSVFEAKAKPNHFTEVFVTHSLEEFDALDEDQDETVEGMVSQLEEFVDEGSKKYTTLVETELG
jgi:predicted KAP-like P-loop ATPase